jgi:hypothetical protein
MASFDGPPEEAIFAFNNGQDEYRGTPRTRIPGVKLALQGVGCGRAAVSEEIDSVMAALITIR